MENNLFLENGIYCFIKPLPYTSFQQGNLIECRQNSLYYDGGRIPNEIQNYIINHHEYLQKIKFVKYNTQVIMKNGKYGIGKIQEFYTLRDNMIFYKIVFEHDTIISTLDECEFIQIYYYISSNGTIGKDIIGKNPQAESFRKKTNNFFLNIRDCQLALQKTLNNI